MDSNPGLSLFQPGSINVENAMQNQEEEEDLEEQKRRQEEIQSFLTKAMDEFNYDDQSTINSSTNVSIDDSNYQQKYKNADIDDQLKVLYEIRVMEVQSLTQQLHSVKQELTQTKDTMGKKLLLAEAETNNIQISLRQSQELLVSKTEQIENLHKDAEDYKIKIEQMGKTLEAIEEERMASKQVNKELLEQLNLMQRGFTTNTMSERQLQENHHKEITKLHTSLENTIMKLQRKENENKEVELKLNEAIKEKDALMVEKGEIINKLTQNLDAAQQQCRELLRMVETVSQENHKLKIATSNMDLAGTLQAGLSDKTEIIKVLQKELEKTHTVHNKHLDEFEALQKAYTQLSKNREVLTNELEHYKSENNHNLVNKEILEDNIKMQHEQINCLKDQITKYNNVNAENEILQKRIITLQEILENYENKNTKECAVQISQIMTSFCEQNDLQKDERAMLEKQLEESKLQIAALNTQLVQYEDDIGNLKVKVTLEHEREDLIKKLQEKAIQLQQMILDKQQMPETNSVAVNTEECEDNNELLQAKYETELIEKEINIRMEIEKEFESKLAKIKSRPKSPKEPCQKCDKLILQIATLEADLKSNREKLQKIQSEMPKMATCQNCPTIKMQFNLTHEELQKQIVNMENMKKQQLDDRELLAKILEDWKVKFIDLENKNIDLTSKYHVSKNVCMDLEKKLKIREMGDAQLVEGLQKEAQNLLKDWNRQAAESIKMITISQRNKILESKQKIDLISKKTDKKIREIESRYVKRRQAIENAKND